MYKQITAEKYRNYLNLPYSYKVDGFIAMGHWDKNGETSRFLNFVRAKYKDEALLDINPKGFLQNITSLKINNKRIWFEVFYGSAILTEFTHFASLFGSKLNVLLGSCGNLLDINDHIDIILPTDSFSESSSCKMYAKESKSVKYSSDSFYLNKVSDILKDKNYRVERGSMITCEAMLAEEYTDVEEWSRNKYIGVDMESAAFFAVSNYFKVSALALLRAGDNLMKKENVTDVSYIARKKNTKDMILNDLMTIAVDSILKS